MECGFSELYCAGRDVHFCIDVGGCKEDLLHRASLRPSGKGFSEKERAGSPPLGLHAKAVEEEEGPEEKWTGEGKMRREKKKSYIKVD